MVWDPFGTIGKAFWIGGGQWAGKSTVARILAERHGLTAFHVDYQGAHSHADRRTARCAAAGGEYSPFDPEFTFVSRTPEEMAADVLAGFQSDFEWVLDDLRALVGPRPIVADGWALRPELVADIGCANRMVVMTPTGEFRQYQLRTLPRAGELSFQLSDPERGQRNRIDRDRLVADDAVKSAEQHDIWVIEVDGSRGAEEIADQVQAYFCLT